MFKRSPITERSMLGRKNIRRSFCFPCGVRARRWNSPKTDKLSLAPELFGPCMCLLGWFSDCIIWRDARVSALTNIMSESVNISIVRTRKANSAA